MMREYHPSEQVGLAIHKHMVKLVSRYAADSVRVVDICASIQPFGAYVQFLIERRSTNQVFEITQAFIFCGDSCFPHGIAAQPD